MVSVRFSPGSVCKVLHVLTAAVEKFVHLWSIQLLILILWTIQDFFGDRRYQNNVAVFSNKCSFKLPKSNIVFSLLEDQLQSNALDFLQKQSNHSPPPSAQRNIFVTQIVGDMWAAGTRVSIFNDKEGKGEGAWEEDCYKYSSYSSPSPCSHNLWSKSMLFVSFNLQSMYLGVAELRKFSLMRQASYILSEFMQLNESHISYLSWIHSPVLLPALDFLKFLLMWAVLFFHGFSAFP